MSEIFKWIKKPFEGKSELSIGRALTEREALYGRMRRHFETVGQQMLLAERGNSKIREIFDDIDFDEVEKILHEHVRRSSDDVGIAPDPIARKEDIFVLPQNGFDAPDVETNKRNAGKASQESGTIRVLEDIVFEANKKKFRHPFYELTPEQQRKERLFRTFKLLEVLFHEEVHMIAKWHGRIHGLGRGRDFNAVMEGQTQTIALDLLQEYIHRKGFRDFTETDYQEYEEMKRKIHSGSYVDEVHLVDLLVSCFSLYAEIPEDDVKKAFVRGHVRGLKLKHTDVDLPAVIGKKNYALLKKAQADSPVVAELIDRLSEREAELSIEKSAIKEVYALLGARSPYDLLRRYSEESEKLIPPESGRLDYRNQELILNKVKNILEQMTGILSDIEKNSQDDILESWYGNALKSAVENKDMAAAERFAKKSLELEPETNPDPVIHTLSLLVNEEFEEAEKYVESINNEEEYTEAENWLNRFRRGGMFISA